MSHKHLSIIPKISLTPFHHSWPSVFPSFCKQTDRREIIGYSNNHHHIITPTFDSRREIPPDSVQVDLRESEPSPCQAFLTPNSTFPTAEVRYTSSCSSSRLRQNKSPPPPSPTWARADSDPICDAAWRDTERKEAIIVHFQQEKRENK
ncbi:hypothetical protein BC936DRAFT_148474 [Jimgerdemannia flammicorona]|uniref:Uncharacterized protein n=1 Tax=Jimgerdemannia flammicorona TaxID=994334 RepID=A0A433DKE9_9FUNG|nr:hypothetical protein BC936DRAFT_148474 [Jimgerdemannia flammicorona]